MALGAYAVTLAAMASAALTGDEAALYDRQIRLWGVDAQQRLRSARVLLCGLGAAMSEVCKNLVLAGLQHLAVNDPTPATHRDLAAHLFLDAASIGKPVRARSHSRRARTRRRAPCLCWNTCADSCLTLVSAPWRARSA